MSLQILHVWFLRFFLLQATLIAVVYGCHGVFEGNSGSFTLSPRDSRSKNGPTGPELCVWIIKRLSSSPSSLHFTLEHLDQESSLNLIPEVDPSRISPQSIRLTSSDVNSSTPIEIPGQAVVVIFSAGPNRTLSSRLSFSWSSQSGADNKRKRVRADAITTTAHQMEVESGQVTWGQFDTVQRTIFNLNSPALSNPNLQSFLSGNFKAQIPKCPLSNPCDCFYLGIFEVVSGGLLREVNKVCGQSADFPVHNLGPSLLAFLYINTSYMDPINDVQDESFVHFEWTTLIEGNDDDPEVTCPTVEPPVETTTTLPTTLSDGLVCAPPATIVPGQCYTESPNFIKLYFYEPARWNQSDLNRLFVNTRLMNNIGLDEILRVSEVQLRSSGLLDTSLDFQSMALTRLGRLSIEHADDLNEISPPANVSSSGAVQLTEFSVWNSPKFGDAALRSSLAHFHPEFLTSVRVSETGFSGLDSDWGLSDFNSLETLDLSSNKIGNLTGGSLRSLRNVKNVMLSENKMTSIGGNGIWINFTGALDHLRNVTVELDLSGNDLTDELFDSEHGLHYPDQPRPVLLKLENNKFGTLSSGNFEPFLNANELNSIELEGNPIECDPRVRWLKDGRERYEHRVFNAYCINDVGKTVFNSNLV